MAAAEERGGVGGVAGLLLELSGHLLAVQEILSSPEIRQLAAYRERRRGCSEAYTWVENRSGSRYWYWYLKCPGRRPASVYLGASPEAHRALMEAAEAVAGVRRALAGAGLGELAGRLAEAARKLERLEAAAPAEAGREEPRQASQRGPGTAPGRRRAGKGDPAGPAPTAQQENARRERQPESGNTVNAANAAAERRAEKARPARTPLGRHAGTETTEEHGRRTA
jgi:hypothetical protein